MTKKRFEMKKGIRQFIDCQNDKTYCEYNLEDVVDLLNEFDEKYIDELNLRETLQQELRRVENENEQLKKILGFLENDNAEDILNVLNSQENKIWELKQENEQLREHFIYLIATALEDKECRKIYAKGLLEIFDDCADLDEAKIKIREYLE